MSNGQKVIGLKFQCYVYHFMFKNVQNKDTHALIVKVINLNNKLPLIKILGKRRQAQVTKPLNKVINAYIFPNFLNFSFVFLSFLNLLASTWTFVSNPSFRFFMHYHQKCHLIRLYQPYHNFIFWCIRPRSSYLQRKQRSC